MGNFEQALTNLIKEAAVYRKIFEQNEDEARLQKVELFGEKLIKKEYMIGFAGHFSAGKSSMINALTGGDLLPSSPIPTSANIVKVKKSPDNYAVIHLVDGTATKYASTNSSAAVKSFSKNGDEVSLIEIGHQQSSLPEGITVMDTPGVDSTDDRHRLSTESALHLADLVFYTMDYNHVQSELNFTFTKQLLKYNPNVYLIINQIDKHRDSELSFEQFKKSVEDSFEMWGVAPKGIFYTSLKSLEHPYNDFPKVKALVDQAMIDWQDAFVQNGQQMLQKLRDEHEAFLLEQQNDIKDEYGPLVNDNEWSALAELEASYADLQRTSSLVQEDSFARNFDQARNALVQNASITPYETRELLKGYLESLSSRFKVGLLFGAKKTKEEKASRKREFEENIQQLLHTQIDVHLKRLMKDVLKQANVLTDAQAVSIDQLQFPVSLEKIEKGFQASDAITGDTILNYANQMKVNIQHAYKELTDPWKEEMAAVVYASSASISSEVTEELHLLEQKIKAVSAVEKITQALEQIDRILESPSMQFVKESEEVIAGWQEKKEIHALEAFSSHKDIEIKIEKTAELVENTLVFEQEEVQAKLSQAFHVSEVLQDVDGFASAAAYIHEKAERLEKQSFTVALFGAFSAGKSSFSNALVGEDVLPVSPNPTTATINKIRPITEGKAHQTADVVLKTHDRMTEDVVRSFEALGLQVGSLEEAYERVEEAVSIDLKEEKQQMHKAFITAFSKGYPSFSTQLGEVIHVAREDFVRYVAEEERSCFVESIDFYYDCPLTRKGITLVDTPGADSINARHTDVAFDYIRNADAILFVTYYNHAFARADQEFLIQLGRVKDAFEMDKMFFIVNAIDLAQNAEEEEAVKSYVGEELQKFGIRHPRVYGISSLQALQAKLQQTTNNAMAEFESAFHHFLENDIKGLAVQGLSEETDKVTERLALLIKRTEENRLRKAERLIELAQLEEEVNRRFSEDFSHVFIANAKNECSELIHYVHQRVFLRFNSFFREAYNPSVFARYSKEDALQLALKELVSMVGFDLTQEMKVTNLRMVQYMKKQLLERQKSEARALKNLDDTLAPILYEAEESALLSFSFPFQDVNAYAGANRFYKNTRTFFERGESEKTKDYLEEVLKEDALHYLTKEKERLELWVKKWLVYEGANLQQHLENECVTQIASERNLLEEGEKLEEWKRVYKKIATKELV